MKKTMRKQKGCPLLLLFQTSQLLMMKTSCFKNSKVRHHFSFLISHSISFVSDSQAIEGDEAAGNYVNRSDIEADNDNNGGEANSGIARNDIRPMSVYTGTQVKNIFSWEVNFLFIAFDYYSLKTVVFYFRALVGGKESDPGLSKNVAVWQILQMHLRVRIIQKNYC